MASAQGYSDVIFLRGGHLSCHFLRKAPRTCQSDFNDKKIAKGKCFGSPARHRDSLIFTAPHCRQHPCLQQCEKVIKFFGVKMLILVSLYRLRFIKRAGDVINLKKLNFREEQKTVFTQNGTLTYITN